MEKIYAVKFFRTQLHRMIRCLGRNYWDQKASRKYHHIIEVFSKNGAVDASEAKCCL